MEIPMEIRTTIEKETRENVIFLGLSTLYGGKRVYHYQKKESGGKEYNFNGISQLEAGTKYILSMLADKEEQVDRIVILASEEARENEAEGYDNCKALDLYKGRIKGFIRGKEEYMLGLKNKIENETRLKHPEYYADKDLDSLFKIIELERNSIYFWETVEKIRGNDPKKKIHLYMDMQGGDRSTIAQMNAIVGLLKNQNVIVKGRYATQFNRNMPDMPQPVVEVSESYRTYDLMTAMQVFRRYGWGEELEQYFGERARDRDQKVIDAIKKASGAIQLCNVDKFNEAIEMIRGLSEEFREREEKEKKEKEKDKDKDKDKENRTELDIVFEDIREDYAPMLDCTEYKYIEQIRWCLKKDFLQQGLTILEAKMPYEYVVNGLVYYCGKEDDQEEILKRFEKIYDDHYKRFQDKKYKMKDLNHYFIKYYLFEKKKNASLPVEIKYGSDSLKSKIENNLKAYYNLCRMRNSTNHAAASMDKNENGFFYYMSKKNLEKPRKERDNNWSDAGENGLKNLKEKIEKFLNAFVELADAVREEYGGDQSVELS